jgi:hypothetical protein
MVNIPFAQFSIAVTLLHSAREQIGESAHYAERAGDKSASDEHEVNPLSIFFD